MKSCPILFNTSMVRALLAGTKLQTRRAINPQPSFVWEKSDYRMQVGGQLVRGPSSEWLHWKGKRIHPRNDPRCPYGQPGDQLWVRETFAHYYRDNSEPLSRGPEDVVYKADGLTPDEYVYGTWKPSIHMPRWASSITLEITGVRVERLQDISVADAIAEGCPGGENGDRYAALEQYRALWESINGPGSWDLNPWVWALNFRRVS